MPQKNSYDYARKNLRASLSSSCFEKKKAKGKSAAIHDSTISERQRMCKSHAAQSYVALRPSGLLRAKRRSCRTKRDNSRRLSPLLCPCYQPHYHRCLPFPGVIKALHSFLRIKQNENVCRRSCRSFRLHFVGLVALMAGGGFGGATTCYVLAKFRASWKIAQ